MSNAIIRPVDCCHPCEDDSTTQIPGPAGADGADGAAGTNGVNSFTLSTGAYTMPAVGGNAALLVANSTWAVVGQYIFLQGGGTLQVVAVPNAAEITAKNLGYSGNAAPTTVIPPASQVGPAGQIGVTGPSGAAALNPISPTTTKGDIIVDNGANSPAAGDVRLGVGTNGQALIAASGQPTGLQWKTIIPNTVANDNNIPRFDGTAGTPIPLQDSKLLITDAGSIQSTPTGGDARGVNAVDLQVIRGANTQVASGADSVISGGQSNTASGDNSVVCGGIENVASAGDSTVAGGDTNVASGGSASVFGGTDNTASGDGSAVIGGSTNTASGTHSAVLGGSVNTASGNLSAALSGSNAVANKYGQIAHASGRFADNGDAQASELVWRKLTTDATANVELFLDGSTARATIPTNTSWAFEIYCMARSSAGVCAAWQVLGAIQNNAGTTALVAAVTTTVIADGTGATFGVAGSFVVDADNTNDALRIRVTGLIAVNIRWVARARIVEVHF